MAALRRIVTGRHGSGSCGAADADLGGCGECGNARAAVREAGPGLGLAVAVPVPVHGDPAPGQGMARMRARFAADQARAAGWRWPRRSWVVAMMARRAAVNEISRGWTGSPARRPLRAGTATAAASRAMARASSAEMTQAACFLGDQRRGCGAEHRPGRWPGFPDRGLGLFQGGLGADPPPVVGLREHPGRVGLAVVQVGDEAEQLRGVVPGDADLVFDHPDGQLLAAAADDGGIGARRAGSPRCG